MARERSADALEVARDLDAHGAHEGGLPAVQGRAEHDLAKRAHHALRTTGLEEIDGPERSVPIGEQDLELFRRRRRGFAARWLERGRFAAARVPRLVDHDRHGLGQVERRVRGVGGDGDDRAARIELGVGEPAVLPSGHDRYRARGQVPHQLGRRLARAQGASLGRPLPAGQHKGGHAVGDGGLERGQDLDPGHEVSRVVRDPLDAPGIEHLGVDQPHPLDPEVLRDAHRARDVDDVLGIDQHQDGRRAPVVIPGRGRRRHTAFPVAPERTRPPSTAMTRAAFAGFRNTIM